MDNILNQCMMRIEKTTARWTLENNDKGRLWVDIETFWEIWKDSRFVPHRTCIGTEQADWGCTLYQPTKRLLRIATKEVNTSIFGPFKTDKGRWFRLSAIFPRYIGRFVVTECEFNPWPRPVMVDCIGINVLRREEER